MLTHIAIIMDGNGRWAKARNLPRAAGHKKGAESVKSVISSCIKNNVDYLTLYAFSSENWKRPEDEVNDLMNLLRFYIGKELKSLHKNGIKIVVIGERSKLPKDIRIQISDAEELTKNNKALSLQIAISYGSRQEISNAAKQIAISYKNGDISLDDINENIFKQYLYTSNIPDPDLLIRTGGDQRISNYLLWQCAYTEFYFTETLWPDFKEKDFDKAIDDFSNRERKFGKTSIDELL